MGLIRRALSLPRVLLRKLRTLSDRIRGIGRIEDRINELISLQTSALQAAVHLIELQQQAARDLPQTHTQVLRQLADLRRQIEALRPGAGAADRRAA